MNGVARARLVAEVSNAGGLGCMGAASMSLDKLKSELEYLNTHTNKPFGVNFLTAFDFVDVQPRVELAIKHGAAVLMFGLAAPAEIIKVCKQKGVKGLPSMCSAVSKNALYDCSWCHMWGSEACSESTGSRFASLVLACIVIVLQAVI